jgi:membrane protein YqaA with SNARE-associated domain
MASAPGPGATGRRTGRPGRHGPLAAAWGFAEATLFFVVPDVHLTALALRDVRAGLWASLWAAAGALAGGALMWAWGAGAPEVAAATLERVPAVGQAMRARVHLELVEQGWAAVLLGPTSGTPYKLYAATSGALGMSLGGLLAITVPARLVRFAGLVLLAGAIARGPLADWSPRRRRALHLSGWAVFYAVYFVAVDW